MSLSIPKAAAEEALKESLDDRSISIPRESGLSLNQDLEFLVKAVDDLEPSKRTAFLTAIINRYYGIKAPTPKSKTEINIEQVKQYVNQMDAKESNYKKMVEIYHLREYCVDLGSFNSESEFVNMRTLMKITKSELKALAKYSLVDKKITTPLFEAYARIESALKLPVRTYFGRWFLNNLKNAYESFADEGIYDDNSYTPWIERSTFRKACPNLKSDLEIALFLTEEARAQIRLGNPDQRAMDNPHQFLLKRKRCIDLLEFGQKGLKEIYDTFLKYETEQ